MDVLGGWCRDFKVELKELLWSKCKGVFHNMQKAVISGTLNIQCLMFIEIKYVKIHAVETWRSQACFCAPYSCLQYLLLNIANCLKTTPPVLEDLSVPPDAKERNF